MSEEGRRSDLLYVRFNDKAGYRAADSLKAWYRESVVANISGVEEAEFMLQSPPILWEAVFGYGPSWMKDPTAAIVTVKDETHYDLVEKQIKDKFSTVDYMRRAPGTLI